MTKGIVRTDNPYGLSDLEIQKIIDNGDRLIITFAISLDFSLLKIVENIPNVTIYYLDEESEVSDGEGEILLNKTNNLMDFLPKYWDFRLEKATVVNLISTKNSYDAAWIKQRIEEFNLDSNDLLSRIGTLEKNQFLSILGTIGLNENDEKIS